MIWMAIMLSGLLAIASLVIDLGHVYLQQNRAQEVADAAAHAGVIYLPDDCPNAIKAAEATAKLNGYETKLDGTVTVTATCVNSTELNVKIQENVNTFFANAAGLVGFDTFNFAKAGQAAFRGEVQLGSPSNVFGGEITGDEWRAEGALGAYQPGYWANINGPATPTSYGDPLHKYQYLIDVKAGGLLDLELFDPVFAIQTNSREFKNDYPQMCKAYDMVHKPSASGSIGDGSGSRFARNGSTSDQNPYCTGDEELNGSVPNMWDGGGFFYCLLFGCRDVDPHTSCTNCNTSAPLDAPKIGSPESFGNDSPLVGQTMPPQEDGPGIQLAGHTSGPPPSRFTGYNLYPRTYFTLYQSDASDADLSDNPVVCSAKTWDPSPGTGVAGYTEDVRWMAYAVFYESYLRNPTDDGWLDQANDDVFTNGSTGKFGSVNGKPFDTAMEQLKNGGWFSSGGWNYDNSDSSAAGLSGNVEQDLKDFAMVNKELFDESYRTWVDLCTPNVTPGKYILGVQSTQGAGSNHFGIRAKVAGSSTDVTVSANGRASIFAKLGSGSGSNFHLAKIREGGTAQRLNLRLFDLGDATNLSGTPVSGTMTILRDNGATFGTGPGETCTWQIEPVTVPLAETSPLKAPYANPGCSIPISKGANDGKFLDVSILVPASYTCAATGVTKCWFKAKFTWPNGTNVHDVVTMEATIKGDPVRLSK